MSVPGGAAGRKRAGEPNVLSNAATPNVLSNMAPPPSLVAPGLAAPGLGSPTLQPRPTSRTGTTPASGAEEWPGAQRTATKPRGRMSFSTLLFLGFLALTAFRAIGELANGDAGSSSPTTAPMASAPSAGLVTFGTSSGGDCTVLGDAVTFFPGQDVWWSAEMATRQGAESDAIVIYFRDGTEFNREYTPADPDFGEWSVLCGNEPVSETGEGRYRLEVWDGKLTTLQSVGEYVIKR